MSDDPSQGSVLEAKRYQAAHFKSVLEAKRYQAAHFNEVPQKQRVMMTDKIIIRKEKKTKSLSFSHIIRERREAPFFETFGDFSGPEKKERKISFLKKTFEEQ